MLKRIEKYIMAGCIAVTVLMYPHMDAGAGHYVCGGGIHVMTQSYNQTLVRYYDHSYQYGTCHVKVEEIQKVTKCQCGFMMTVNTISKTEAHSMPH